MGLEPLVRIGPDPFKPLDVKDLTWRLKVLINSRVKIVYWGGFVLIIYNSFYYFIILLFILAFYFRFPPQFVNKLSNSSRLMD